MSMSILMDLLGWWPAVTGVIAAASTVAALTPTPKDDALIANLYKIIDFLALNIGKAKT
jgi:hypothetical protein